MANLFIHRFYNCQRKYFRRSPVFNVFMGDGVFWSSNESFPRQLSGIKLSWFYSATSDNFKIAVTIHLPAERRPTHVHAMVKSSIFSRLVTVLHNKPTIGYRLPKYNSRIVIQLLIYIHRNLEAYVFIILRSWRYCVVVEVRFGGEASLRSPTLHHSIYHFLPPSPLHTIPPSKSNSTSRLSSLHYSFWFFLLSIPSIIS